MFNKRESGDDMMQKVRASQGFFAVKSLEKQHSHVNL
jgi:hypothetical protein